jgi:F0F1-type ATP synthase membrane subunit b/b'
MADEVYHTRQGPSAVAWLALILAILALILGWMAYNRTGKDLEDRISDAVEGAAQNADEATQDAGEAAQDATDTIEEGVDTGPDGVDDGTQ